MPMYKSRRPLRLAALLLGWSLVASAEVAVPPQTVTLASGTARRLDIRFEPGPRAGALLGVRLVPGRNWRDDILVRGMGDRFSPVPTGGGWEWLVPPGGATRVLPVQVTARTCNGLSRYPATLEVWAAGTDSPVELLASVPLVFSVERMGSSCAIVRTGAVGGTMLILCLPLYLWSMWTHSRFIDGKDLVARIKPLLKREGHSWTHYRVRQQVVEDGVRGGLSTGSRLLAWLAANPFRFGLPGQRYEETVEVALSRRPLGIQVWPTERARRNPVPGKLYARATEGGLIFFGSFNRRHLDGREWEELCGFVPHTSADKTLLSSPPELEDESEDLDRTGWEIRPPVRRSDRS